MRVGITESDLPRAVLLVVGGGILFLIIFLASSYWRRQFIPTPVQAKIQSIIVTPLENLSGDPKQDYLADGMTYALRRNLTQIKELMVIRWPKKPLPEVAAGVECGLGIGRRRGANRGPGADRRPVDRASDRTGSFGRRATKGTCRIF